MFFTFLKLLLHQSLEISKNGKIMLFLPFTFSLDKKYLKNTARKYVPNTFFLFPASPWVVGRREHDPYRRPPLHDAEWYPWGGGHLRVEVDPESLRQEHRCRHPCPAAGVVATVEPEDGAAAAGMQEEEEEEGLWTLHVQFIGLWRYKLFSFCSLWPLTF